MVLSIAVGKLQRPSPTCEQSVAYWNYAVWLLASVVLQAAVHAALAWHSSQGSILEVHKRCALPKPAAAVYYCMHKMQRAPRIAQCTASRLPA